MIAHSAQLRKIVDPTLVPVTPRNSHEFRYKLVHGAPLPLAAMAKYESSEVQANSHYVMSTIHRATTLTPILRGIISEANHFLALEKLTQSR